MSKGAKRKTILPEAYTSECAAEPKPGMAAKEISEAEILPLISLQGMEYLADFLYKKMEEEGAV